MDKEDASKEPPGHTTSAESEDLKRQSSAPSSLSCKRDNPQSAIASSPFATLTRQQKSIFASQHRPGTSKFNEFCTIATPKPNVASRFLNSRQTSPFQKFFVATKSQSHAEEGSDLESASVHSGHASIASGANAKSSLESCVLKTAASIKAGQSNPLSSNDEDAAFFDVRRVYPVYDAAVPVKECDISNEIFAAKTIMAQQSSASDSNFGKDPQFSLYKNKGFHSDENCKNKITAATNERRQLFESQLLSVKEQANEKMSQVNEKDIDEKAEEESSMSLLPQCMDVFELTKKYEEQRDQLNTALQRYK